LIDGAGSLEDTAVHRNPLAGPHTQSVTHLDGRERHVRFGAVRLDPPGLLGRQAQQRPQRGPGAAPGLQLHDLAQQDQDGDDGGRLEVKGDGAVRIAKRRGEAGRNEQGSQARGIGGTGAQGNQGEHVRGKPPDRIPSTPEEREAGPQDDRGRERQLEPAEKWRRHGRAPMQAGNHLSHAQDEQGSGQDGSDFQPPGHVRLLGILGFESLHLQRLEPHAANRAGSRTDLADFGVHRAGIDPRGARRLAGDPHGNPRILQACSRREIGCGILFELLQTPVAAEVIVDARMRMLAGRRGRIHVHLTNGVFASGHCGMTPLLHAPPFSARRGRHDTARCFARGGGSSREKVHGSRTFDAARRKRIRRFHPGNTPV
jgi:hypothetical protein